MKMAHKQGDASFESMVLDRIRVRDRSYELRYNRCGKANCWCKRKHEDPSMAGVPGHGPYWYMVVMRGRRCKRIYIGKELDTRKGRTEGEE